MKMQVGCSHLHVRRNPCVSSPSLNFSTITTCSNASTPHSIIYISLYIYLSISIYIYTYNLYIQKKKICLLLLFKFKESLPQPPPPPIPPSPPPSTTTTNHQQPPYGESHHQSLSHKISNIITPTQWVLTSAPRLLSKQSPLPSPPSGPSSAVSITHKHTNIFSKAVTLFLVMVTWEH